MLQQQQQISTEPNTPWNDVKYVKGLLYSTVDKAEKIQQELNICQQKLAKKDNLFTSQFMDLEKTHNEEIQILSRKNDVLLKEKNEATFLIQLQKESLEKMSSNISDLENIIAGLKVVLK